MDEVFKRDQRATDICDENPGALLQWPCYGGLGQRWEFDQVGPGAFYSVIKNVYTGLAINQAGPTTAPGGRHPMAADVGRQTSGS
ncbi:RICIN domain-containing protein [Solirubrobacter sp. CPCC 204708]|uniref:RICIN domain-containing protein n=1 Tax=Solirubrobacter deserti TaxID=2282478 RepID=A0ABT4RQP9_9ACTN|nr:RICIN domain-containing protein [Solirubrobacter deserti]MBE2319366.1 RICIN domain-containing protein [Solirubrobacter deserti]MDA0140864.1 RICIN domain-containing protein [Solirubrobacter deserti]